MWRKARSSAVGLLLPGLLAAACLVPLRSPAIARTVPVSELVIDARTGHSLYAADADRARPVASLTKMMTLLLVFDALEAGRIGGNDRIAMTPEGARQAPSRLGLARGAKIGIGDATRAVAVISANDVAVALADRLAGSEAGFVREMNRRARQIGMTNTHFGSATGLPTSHGWSTARDMALLSRYLVTRYPARYRLFATRSIRWRQRVRPNHNQLLGKVDGVDGIKTGYTVPAGFCLAASGRRGGRRVIVVVLGARTAAARDLLVANLLEAGFSSRPPAIAATRTGGDAADRPVPGRHGSGIHTPPVPKQANHRPRRHR